MEEVIVSVPVSLMKALMARLEFKGQRHGKFITAKEADFFSGGDACQKMLGYLDDSDTTMIAVDQKGNLYQMPHIRSFRDAWHDGIRFSFAFTVPTAFLNWKDFASLPPINKDYVQIETT